MLKDFVYNVLERRHFWRYATFGEIADLYLAQTLRTAAISLVSGFSSVFMYKQGYSLIFIMIFWAIYFLAKVVLMPFAGMIISRFGTVACTMLSNILYIPAIIALSLIPELKLTGLIIYGSFLALSVMIHELCYMIDFSRVKSVEHAGKEIALMNIFNKIVITIGPLIGGLIALWFNVQVTMWVAGSVLVFAGLPLLKLKNQSEKHHQFKLQGFPWGLVLPGLFARFSIGFDIESSGNIWGLFLAIILFPSAGNAIYVTLGALSSATFIVAIITSAVFGKLIDNKKGRSLLRAGVSANIIIHLSRLLISTPVGVVGVNVTKEVAAAAQGMTFMRGMFDTADASGFRITYLVIQDIVKNLGEAVACAAMALCAMFIGGRTGFSVFYAVTAVICIPIFFSGFKMYSK